MTCQTCRHYGTTRLVTCPLQGKVADSYAAGGTCWQAKSAPLGPQTSQHALKRPEPVMLDAKPAKLERDLQRLCEQELSRRGIEFLHLSPKAREKCGWPDLVFCQAGSPCAIELKSVDGKLSEIQKSVMSRMEKNGWECAVFRSFDQFKAFLDE